jgi:hypothetical protein
MPATLHPPIVRFKDYVCKIVFAQYSNGRTAIELVDAEGWHEPIARASVNLPDAPLEDDEIFIKDWSENEGMVGALVRAGVVSESIGYEPSGFVMVDKCKLLTPPSMFEENNSEDSNSQTKDQQAQ